MHLDQWLGQTISGLGEAAAKTGHGDDDVQHGHAPSDCQHVKSDDANWNFSNRQHRVCRPQALEEGGIPNCLTLK